MRIAIVAGPFVPIPPNKYGGIEQIIYYLIKGLKESGHEPILLGPADSTVDCEIIPICDKALYFPRNKEELKTHEKLVAKANKQTGKKLRALLPDIDIIHSHGYDTSKFKYFPNITTLHNKITFNDLDYFSKRKDLLYASISQNQQAACPDLSYVGVVYNGEDPEEFPIVTKPDDYVCFLGRFDRDKNPHLAIQLAINLGLKIKLAGKIDHDGEGYFHEEVEKYLGHPLVEYYGEIGLRAKAELLSKALCNLHPTNFREPFGLTVLEAAYCGTPTMAIARGSMPELIEPGRTGLLVEDFIEGRYHIEECFKLDREYIALRSRQLFNYHSMAQQYVGIYKKVIQQMGIKSKSSDPYLKRFYGQLKENMEYMRERYIN
ncbi:MAG TPA: glycosyltransferase family 4 protein [Patescibacteria group bacterium]|nr:glycosyltransferase family 4 protein [Patescibacteria group bacterium]